MVLALDASYSYTSNPDECKVKTSPGSTFKIPHALIALSTGVITDPLATVKWDGSDLPNASWERDHSMDSAIKSSMLWFFRRTAGLIGKDSMLAKLQKLNYAEDTFAEDVISFWLNGDLLVAPQEQLEFMRRFAGNELPVEKTYIDAVNAAFLMPSGKVTLASGVHDFALAWPSLGAVYAKTGNAIVKGEYVSWLIGYFATTDQIFVFVSRSRSDTAIPPTAGSDPAVCVLNEIAADSAL